MDQSTFLTGCRFPFKVCSRSWKPDVLVLMGPFVDCENARLKRADVAMTYAEIFQEQVCDVA